MSTYISKHKAFKTLVVQETNRSAKGFRYNGADAHGMIVYQCQQSRPKLCPCMQENDVRFNYVITLVL